MTTERITEPGTEENLALESDAHPFDTEPVVPSLPHPVLVDGICGVAAIGSHGTERASNGKKYRISRVAHCRH